MSVYSQTTAYSPVLDCKATRLSMVRPDGQELFMIVPRTKGRSWRKDRDEALELIQQAIDEGCEPGEVRVSG